MRMSSTGTLADSIFILRGRVVLQHEKFQSAPGSRVGTPAYLAPEVIMTTKGQTYDGKVTLSICTHLAASSNPCSAQLRGSSSLDVSSMGLITRVCGSSRAGAL